jgi:serine/threonine protein kinase
MTEREIFIAALQRQGPAERQAYLEEACARLPDLRRQVEHLLRLHESAGSFLEKPAAGSPAAEEFPDTAGQAPSGGAPGVVIGPYKLVEQIGEGGMGTVWMAQQTEPVRRLVAVKLIKAGMDSRQVIARFEAERQALALMDHPNIARVLDAGTTGAGRPYFVMDLVKGVPITRYCDEHRLTLRQRLELFIPVCQAVQHAHQKGVIHRDLKPGNVLVALYDGKPVPKVIDFGVAKAAGEPLTERTLVTGFGALVGTLEYMSPEQAEINQLDIDTRSDIYALGVLLYELLTGSPPFTREELQKGGMLEMLWVIHEREPTKPSTKLSTAEGLPTLAANRGTEPAKLKKLVRGELDWIAMKALEKDRSRRYETANGLAMDLQRYLADEPVLACPPSAGYRLRKFARRNGSGLAVAGLVLFFLVLLGSVAGWAWRDRDARAREAELERLARAAELANNLERAVQRAELLQRGGRHGEALAALERAQLLAREGEPSRPLRQRIDCVQRLLDAERRDLECVTRFETILSEERCASDGLKDVRRTDDANAELREALKQYGIEVAVTPPADAAARIQASRPAVQSHVVAALDECLCAVPVPNARTRQWFVDVLQEADGETRRRNVRNAWLRNPQNAKARSKWAGYWYNQALLQSDNRRYCRARRGFSKAIEIEPDLVIAWHSLDVLRLHAGDAAEHRRLCGEMMARFSGTENLDSLTQVIWSCVLAPDSVQNFDPVLQLAARVARDFPGSKNNRLLHGAALYRSGRWEAAIEEIHQSQRANIHDLSWPAQESFLAMAHMRLGQVEDARRWLDAVVKWERENQGAPWWACVLTEILRREAEARIEQGGDDLSRKKEVEK